MSVNRRPARSARPTRKQLQADYRANLSGDSDASEAEDDAAASPDSGGYEPNDIAQADDDDDFAPVENASSGPESDYDLNELDLEDDELNFDDDASTPAPSSAKRVKGTAKRRKLDKSLKKSIRQARGGDGANSIDAIRTALFGPDKEDQDPATRHMFRWRKEFVLPSRKADRGGAGGYMRSLYHSDEQRRREAAEDWLWYDSEGGKEAFRQRQVCEDIGATAAADYLPADTGPACCVLGSFRDQKVYEVPHGSVFASDTPFTEEAPAGDEEATTSKRGWLLNLGERISQAEWAPNQSGTQQYLAVTTAPTRDPTQPDPSTGDVRSSFRPQPASKSAIQIWQVPSGDGDRPERPSLRHVICTDWNDIKAIRWCPIVRQEGAKPGTGQLGLLALVCSDGAVRVLDISLPPASFSPTYTIYKDAAFTSRPPTGVFTTVTWLSSRSIAAGTSTGHVAIFSLPSSHHPHPKPLLYSLLHPCYITALTTCYPSRPHMLAATSAFGHASVTDITRVSAAEGFSPTNTVYSPRSRRIRLSLQWHDWSQMLLTCDDAGALYGLPLRRFHGFSVFCRVKSAASAVVVSACHPFVALAGMGGEVVTLNFLRKAMAWKGAAWALKWFHHEFRSGTREEVQMPGLTGHEMEVDAVAEVETETVEQMGSNGQSDTLAKDEKDMIRITEGFKAEQFLLTRGGVKAEDAPSDGLLTIHEAQTAITAVSWNPNLQCGGWIAAGTGSGLLRIEDVGMDR